MVACAGRETEFNHLQTMWKICLILADHPPGREGLVEFSMYCCNRAVTPACAGAENSLRKVLTGFVVCI